DFDSVRTGVFVRERTSPNARPAHAGPCRGDAPFDTLGDCADPEWAATSL
ncbi:unnamed protein product, partial [marine sediment metagenome]